MKGYFLLSFIVAAILFELWVLFHVVDVLSALPGDLLFSTSLLLAIIGLLGALAKKLNRSISPLFLFVSLTERLMRVVAAPFIIQYYVFRRLQSLVSFHLRPVSMEQLAGATEPFLLYLRSFDDDRKAAPEQRPEFSLDPVDYANSVGKSVTGQDLIEKILADQFLPHMKVMCIGRPREKYPISNFLRLYVDDIAWKAVVEELMEAAIVVVIRVADTEGLRWELETAREKGLIGKLVLFFCSPVGSPFWQAEIRTTMSHFCGATPSLAELPQCAYYCRFSSGSEPVFVPTARQIASRFRWLRECSHILIADLVSNSPSLFRDPRRTRKSSKVRKALRQLGLSDTLGLTPR